ncbi:unnamed protein product [Leptosia nina]|uniref:Integrase catalytic domain-containing protein n=1 Tax=Leptosia nina TaxID=320188 RepID=A0AAV1JDL7_9NEOP
MPVTRSQRGAARTAEDSTSATATSDTDYTTTATTSGTERTTSEETVASQGAASQPGRTMTLVPAGSTRQASPQARTARTARTRASTMRRTLEAQEELARLELAQAEAAARLARIRLQRAQEEEEDSVYGSSDDERNKDIEEWIRSSGRQEAEEPKPEPQKKPKDTAKDIVHAFKEALRENTAQPKYIQELPVFEGDSCEWTAFRVVYDDTATMFTATQNMARLRRAIKGAAREGIKSLLYSEAQPSEVMDALRRRYGRPDALVLAELEKVKALPRMTESPRDICVFASQINNSVAAIRGLKRQQYLHSPDMVKSIIEKMPTILKFRWYDYTARKEDDAFSDLRLIGEFLNQEADKCGAFATLEENRATSRRPLRHSAHNVQEEARRCPHCDEAHALLECVNFQKAPVRERWHIVKQNRICFKCLGGKHRKESCRKPPCRICKKWHHALLHVDVRTEEREPTTSEMNVTAAVNTARNARALLKMARVKVFGPKGTRQITALLDEGSTLTLLDSTVAEELGINGRPQELSIETVGGKRLKTRSIETDLQIKGRGQKFKRTLHGVRTMDNLQLSPQFVDKKIIESCSHLKDLVETLWHEAEAPALLIGQDNWDCIVSLEVRRGRPGQLVASRTKLGWVLHGTEHGGRSVHQVNTCLHMKEDAIYELMKEHFALESLGVQAKRPTTDIEARALSLLESTSRRREDGRYEVSLLWKQDNSIMPESRDMALSRLKNIERKLQRDQHMKTEYTRQIKHLLEEGYAEEAPEDCLSKRKWYLPHFAVTHPLKKKIRIVFDAASRSHGISLNDALLPGPDLLQSLFGVLLRFRQGPIAVAADIKEMFLQVRIKPEDRDSLRFLWRENDNDPIREYRMTSVVFGAASSPCSAIYAKNKNAEDWSQMYPEAATAIVRNHYMDDYLQSFHDVSKGQEIAHQVNEVHLKAHFELRGWASNHEGLLRHLGVKKSTAEVVAIGESEEKTLGLRWLTKSDELGFRTELRKTPEDVASGESTPTKRQVTSAVMATFDPLGLVSPIVIQGKKLIQRIWRSGVGWDDAIDEEDYEVWKKYLQAMKTASDLLIPRCITPICTEGELHTFVDASESAYAAAVYWRAREQDGFRLNLVAAKARVAPLKPTSIPRLELQAALLGARLSRSIEGELDLKITKRTYWSDSSVVLSWIKSDPRTFKTFVAHRLAEIEELTNAKDWRWVSTSDNPADDATRQTPDNFDAAHRWFKGPEFLHRDESQWPTPRKFERHGTDEDKSDKVYHAFVEAESTPSPERFSSWLRLWRTTARVLQFIKLCRNKHAVNACRKRDETWKPQKPKIAKKTTQRKGEPTRNFSVIDHETLVEAEKLLLKRSQGESFADEISSAKKGHSLGRTSKLRLFETKYQDGLLRLQSRVGAISGVSGTYKTPILLDAKNHIARLILEDYHRRFNHANHATVMNEIRQRYWIIGLRAAIKGMQRRCQTCIMRRASPVTPPMGDLPEERLRHGTHPFTCTGVDYFGPMTITVARRNEKRWGALFTCLTTRAIHLELVPTLSTDSMIMALRRFAARRGAPRVLYSDNGTNFIGANRELKEAWEALAKDNLATEAEKLGVHWKFIPPGAPNMGGAWERMVRSIKVALEATLRERRPREEVLHTLLLEAEHIVNSRPLTNLTDNAEEEALTPNHFLIGRSCGAARIGAFANEELVGRDTWKTTQLLADHFWKRWLQEYLPTLLPRRIDGRTDRARNLREGDIVYIVDPTLPRCTWPRGRVKATHPGVDGRVRVVDVSTKAGVLRRPASRIVLLVPMESPGQEIGATARGGEL